MFSANWLDGATQSNIRSAVLFYVHKYCEFYFVLGMPHLHLLLILDKRSRITTPDQVDQYISARIPPLPSRDDTSPAADQARRLHYYVTTMMLHDCNAACLEQRTVDGVVKTICNKHFPKPYSDQTEISGNI